MTTKSKAQIASVDLDVDLSSLDLPDAIKAKLAAKLEKAQENMEKRIAKRVERLVERQAAKAEFEEQVADLRGELDGNLATIAKLRARNKAIRAEIKDAREEWKSNR
jgi:septal ring factor EnvC (AmiA/AmiB activator)